MRAIFDNVTLLVVVVTLLSFAVVALLFMLSSALNLRFDLKFDGGRRKGQEEKRNDAAAASPSAPQAGTDGQSIPPSPSVPSRTVFVIDALTMAALYRYCTAQAPTEVFCYVAGFKLAADRMLLKHIIPVAHARQSPIGAKTDAASTFRAYELLDELGLRLAAHCHSHPGFGPEGTNPSCIDYKYVADLAAGSSHPLGLIVSRGKSGNGYIRAFGHDALEFDIELYGNGVKKVSEDEKSFQIFEIEPRLATGDVPVALPRTAGPAASASPTGFVARV